MSKARGNYWFLCALIILNACSGAPSPSVSSTYEKLIGRWQGTGYQNSGSSWTIDVSILPNPQLNRSAANIRYPSLNCSGTWYYLGSFGDAVDFEEEITSGQSRCVVSGKVRIVLNETGTAGFFYTAADKSSYTSSGVLSKVQD